jgi:hypothetical protein
VGRREVEKREYEGSGKVEGWGWEGHAGRLTCESSRHKIRL